MTDRYDKAYSNGMRKEETAILRASPPDVRNRWSGAIRILGSASTHVGTEPTSLAEGYTIEPV